MKTIKRYYGLAKPGIIYGNILVAAAAFAFGSQGGIEWEKFFLMLAGLACVIGGSCVLNNIADRRLDAKMTRTAGRALAAGLISPRRAALYAGVLLGFGVTLLWATNIFALAAALAGAVVYVCMYTPLKPRSSLALYVGAVAGATPPVVGYAAAAGRLDWYAAALFAVLYLWQVPHFLAIARYRFSEYAAAGIPLAVREPRTDKEKKNARMAFFGSLVVLLAFCGMLAVL